MVCLVSGIPFDESRMTKHWTVVRKIGKNGHKFFINLGQKKSHYTPVSRRSYFGTKFQNSSENI